jgi:hypothetical protein
MCETRSVRTGQIEFENRANVAISDDDSLVPRQGFVTKLVPVDELLHIIEKLLRRSPTIPAGKVRDARKPVRAKREHTPEKLGAEWGMSKQESQVKRIFGLRSDVGVTT